MSAHPVKKFLKRTTNLALKNEIAFLFKNFSVSEVYLEADEAGVNQTWQEGKKQPNGCY